MQTFIDKMTGNVVGECSHEDCGGIFEARELTLCYEDYYGSIYELQLCETCFEIEDASRYSNIIVPDEDGFIG